MVEFSFFENEVKFEATSVFDLEHCVTIDSISDDTDKPLFGNEERVVIIDLEN